MKNTRTIIIILLFTLTSNLFFSCKKHFKSVSKLSEYVRQDNYSDLYYELMNNRRNYREESLLFYDIIMSSVVNKPEKSNQLINKFRSKFSGIDDTTKYYITQSEYNNYLKLCNYKKLKEIGDVMIEKYKCYIDSSEYIELKDDNVRYSFLENEKSISLNKKADTKLKVTKDLAGYTLLTIKSSNDSTVNLVFDTGANVNAITQSSAIKLNLHIIPNSKIHVMGGTGVRNEAQIGMAEKITIGEIEILNAEFVVFADSLFTFAGGRYIINGAIGFPIFSRFEEITYTDSTLFIPKTPTLNAGEPNMFIKSDDYFLAISYKCRKYPFFFDTGNYETYFTQNFYNIDSSFFNTLKDTILTYAGVGGQVHSRAKRPIEISLNYSGKNFNLVRPFVEMEDREMYSTTYGNIGKDFMNQYKKRIMSFREARIEFE
jgi:hypothetical protein